MGKVSYFKKDQYWDYSVSNLVKLKTLLSKCGSLAQDKIF